MQKLCAFEEKLAISLKKLLGARFPKILGAAVSGGADSTSLLLSLASLSSYCKSGAEGRQSVFGGEPFPKIVCVTVDHSIRPEEESSGDAAYVKDLCERLGVECFVKKIERGAVERLCGERKKGVEDAARALRYQAFESFAKESGAEFICLAHNQNDALETLLMRFLQGSGSEALGGICERRGIFLRPLLETSRAEIEEYLRLKGVSWRTDSTNGDNKYLRNRIRNSLVPFLDENFVGWKKALLAGAEKAAGDDLALDVFLNEKLESFKEKDGQDFFELSKKADGSFEYSAKIFSSLPAALRRRLLYRTFEAMGVQDRVPYSFVKQISLWPESAFKNASAAGLFACAKKDKVFIKKSQKEATESGFFDIIMEDEPVRGLSVLRSAAVGDKVRNGI